MAVRSAEEILAALREVTGERTDDGFLGLMEDITDTLNRPDESEEWKTKYEENDLMWRERYRDRFFSNEPGQTEATVYEEVMKKEAAVEKEEPRTYDDLFD